MTAIQAKGAARKDRRVTWRCSFVRVQLRIRMPIGALKPARFAKTLPSHLHMSQRHQATFALIPILHHFENFFW
jgi:hypothetical protein